MVEFRKKFSHYYLLYLTKLKLKFKNIWYNFKGSSIKDKEEVYRKITEFLETEQESILVEKNDILKNFFIFNKKIVDDIIIPRTDIIAVKKDINLASLINTINHHSLTRLLVYHDTMDNVIGFIHIKDLFKVITVGEKFDIEKIIRKPIISTNVVGLWDLFKEMQSKKIHLATIIDEYGGLDGIVTIENIIAQIFGNFTDECSNNDDGNNYKVITPTMIIASGRTKIETLEKILGVELKTSEDEFDTIGGLVMANIGRVPGKGEKISLNNNIEVEVLDSNARTIQSLKIILNKENIN